MRKMWGRGWYLENVLLDRCSIHDLQNATLTFIHELKYFLGVSSYRRCMGFLVCLLHCLHDAGL